MVELDQRLGLVVGKPDCRDGLQLDERDRKMGNCVAGKVQDSKVDDVTKLSRKAGQLVSVRRENLQFLTGANLGGEILEVVLVNIECVKAPQPAD